MSDGPKETAESIQYGNRFGSIYFGGLNLAGKGGLESDVISGITLQAHNSLHYLQMENDGPRKGWTLQRNPGVWEVKCADKVEEGQIGGMIHVENGDLVLKAPNGRIRLQAVDIDIRAEGYDSTTGFVNLDSNNTVKVKTGKFKVTADDGVSLFSPQSINIVSNTAMNLASNFVGGFTSAVAQFGAKAFPQSKEIFKTLDRFS